MVDDTYGMCRAGKGSSVEDEMTVGTQISPRMQPARAGANQDNTKPTTTNLFQRPDRSYNVSFLQRCSWSYI
jgi:hypothetical protein